MKVFIKLATFNFFYFIVFVFVDKIFELSTIPQTKTPISELPFYVSVPLAFLLLSFLPVWFWVLYKMIKNRYFFWFPIVLIMPPVSFFVTNKHYNV
jgi:hypothetical protein